MDRNALVEKCKAVLEAEGYLCMQSTVTSGNPDSVILKTIIMLEALGLIEIARHDTPHHPV